MIPADALDKGVEGVKDADVAYMKTPVTSSPNWTKYVASLADQGLPPLAVITEISVVPDAKTQFKVLFKARAIVEDGVVIEALINRSDAVDKDIDFPYKSVQANEAPASRKGMPTSKSAVTRPPVRKVGSVNTNSSKRAKY